MITWLIALLMIMQDSTATQDTTAAEPPIDMNSAIHQPWILIHPSQLWTLDSLTNKLDQDSVAQLEKLPSWLRPALFDVMARTDLGIRHMIVSTLQQAYTENPDIVDEVAFSFAHTPLSDLEDPAFDPYLFIENALAIYSDAEKASTYARLIEVEDDGGPYTTVELRLSSGWWRAPRWAYYWGVVHPRLTDDSPFYINPRNANPLARDEGGAFWRTYFMADLERDSLPPTPYAPFCLKYPEVISDEDLQNMQADGAIDITAGDPIIDLVSGDGMPLLVHYAYYQDGGTISTSGRVTATTLRLEGMDSALLGNLISGGSVYGAVLDSNSARILVLRDATAFGKDVEDYLDAQGFQYTVMDATEIFDTLDSTVLDGFREIIVPGGQTSRLYEALEAQSELFEQWVSRHGDAVFLFFGATNGVDWNDYALPFGFARVSSDHISGVEAAGYTHLEDAVFAGSQDAIVWDGTMYASLDGDRDLAPESMMILDRIGWFVSQMLEARVGEIIDAMNRGEYVGPDGTCFGMGCYVRTAYSVRIGYQHYGNCGELQDMVITTGRTALLPTFGVSGPPEDHVWNEFYLDDQWVPFQVDWSDGPTRIAVPGNAQDKDYGGGKDLSMVTWDRPDGRQFPVIERYSKTVTLRLSVKDSSGRPVQGASVLVASETWSDPNSLTLAVLVHTDASGMAEIPFGDHQNAYVRVDPPVDSTGLGSWPDPDHVQWILCADATATAAGGASCPNTAPWDSQSSMPLGDAVGSTYEIPITLSGSAPTLPVIHVPETPASLDCSLPKKTMVLAWQLGDDAYRAIHVNALYGEITEDWEEDTPAVYLMDATNAALLASGQDATAITVLPADGKLHFYPYDPSVGTPQIVVDNRGTWGISRYVPLFRVTSTVYSSALEQWCADSTGSSDSSDIEVTSGGGCACSIGNNSNNFNELYHIIIFMLAMMLFMRMGKTDNKDESDTQEG